MTARAPDGCSVPRALRLVVPMTDAQRTHCIAHDLAYANGGTRRQRLLADCALLAGFLTEGMDADLAESCFDGIRRYGLPHWGPEGRYVDVLPGETEEGP